MPHPPRPPSLPASTTFNPLRRRRSRSRRRHRHRRRTPRLWTPPLSLFLFTPSRPPPQLTLKSPRSFVRSFVLCQRGGGTGISNPRCFSLTSPSPMNDARKWSAEHPSLFLERAGFFERVCSRFISDVSSNCTKSLVRNFIRTTCKN